MRRFLSLSSLCLLSTLASADVRLATIFGEHMVLQQQSHVAIWGWADPGEKVRVQGSWGLDSGPFTVANSDGRWSLRLETPKAGGPFTVTVQGNNTLTFHDVMIGEVWVCSGQSNMEWRMTQSANPEEEIAAANFPNIRIFDVQRAIAMEPAEDVKGSWARVSPQSIPAFSAVGYHFGRTIHESTGVPIGLIGSNWGGTVAESWTSREHLAEFPEFDPLFSRIDEVLASGDGGGSLTQKQRGWWEKLESQDPGIQGKWMNARFDTSAWETATLPGLFRDFGHGDYDGTMWYRREVTVPATWSNQDLVLELGPVDDMDLTYFNGHLVGATRADGQWQSPRTYTIPAAQVFVGGTNVITVCAVDTGGGGAIGLGHEMNLKQADESRSGSLDLSGEWRANKGAAIGSLGAYPRGNWFHANYVTALNNGMIAPIAPYGIRGAIWYQGESNRGRAAQYRRIFPNMIEGWRKQWGIGDFPFYFVQLAPFHYGGDTGQLGELREAQMMTLDLPATGMAVTMDIGNVRDIHPRNKRDVGKRLALWALAKDYGQDIVYSGPLYRSMVVVGSTARLHFEHAEGLRFEGEPKHFLMAGEDGVFHEAQAVIDGSTLLVTCDAVSKPRSVRYGWGTTDEGCLVNGAGLPASSFRTDAWAPVSSWQ